MLILNSRTNIDGYVLDFVHEVEITSSWDNLTDTATLILPKKIVFKRDGVVTDNIVSSDNPIFRVGKFCDLLAGYSGGINTDGLENRFTGYITDVRPKFPMEIMLEDEMYNLKQIKVGQYSKKNLTLKQLLTDIMPDNVPFVADDRNIGYLRIKDPNTTVAGVLKHLKDKQGIISYFRDFTLFCGFAYTTEQDYLDEEKEPIIFDARKNIINSDDLTYRKEGQYKVRVKVVSIFDDNTKIEVEVGEEGGDNFTIYVYNVPEKDLQERAENELKKFNYTGFKGTFETFLEPQVKHGDLVQLVDDRISDKNGVYLVKSVVTRYGMGGGRQIIELDRLASDI